MAALKLFTFVITVLAQFKEGGEYLSVLEIESKKDLRSRVRVIHYDPIEAKKLVEDSEECQGQVTHAIDVKCVVELEKVEEDLVGLIFHD